MSDDIKSVGSNSGLTFEKFKEELREDYRLICESREASLLGRKEVLTGKAKFGIFGDGKELAQVALAKTFQAGDIRSGYYRDQTWMMAIGQLSVEQFFAQLYADTNPDHEPASAGRQMNSHFSTPFLDENGDWLDLTKSKNSSADTSPTASQMARSVGLALASKLYRNESVLKGKNNFSDQGNEVIFASIGDASTSEGIFWESVNAAGVMKIPLAISIWDDGYGISVPQKHQTTKQNLSEILSGFQARNGEGIEIYTVKGWDYAALCETYKKGIAKVRETHIPAIFHITEVTQPQGHSTSGSHERYKSKDRLQWEIDFDCVKRMREWLLANALASEEELEEIAQSAKKSVAGAKRSAWSNFIDPIKAEMQNALSCIEAVRAESSNSTFIEPVVQSLTSNTEPIRKDILKAMKQVARLTQGEVAESRKQLLNEIARYENQIQESFSKHLHSESAQSALKVPEIPAEYDSESKEINGFEVLNACFDQILSNRPDVVAFGEDVGHIGDVNQGFAGLQEKHGKLRVFDTGIREATIMGQGIGLAMRGIRPIAEIQYLDYLIYGLQPLVDDLATMQYRTFGRQKAPLIIRTRGHRLEGIWHTGSPMGMIINSLRGVHVLTPRNMTQAAGFYNTMLRSDEPALIIECLNGYRLKEKLPTNIAEFTVPLGKVETLVEGTDLTLVTYGSCVRIAEEAMVQLNQAGVSVELIDAQSMLPFDLNHDIVKSLEKTNRIVFLDEDVPGGATAYMMQQVLEVQQGYRFLDSAPLTITAKAHRAAYGSDGDYFCKPNAEQIFEAIYAMMHEADPQQFPDWR